MKKYVLVVLLLMMIISISGCKKVVYTTTCIKGDRIDKIVYTEDEILEKYYDNEGGEYEGIVVNNILIFVDEVYIGTHEENDYVCATEEN